MSNEIDVFDKDKIQLIKDTIARGATNDEFKIFLHVCQKTGLDPFAKQIWLVKRWDSNLKRESMSIQTGIDGYRLIADRTGNYSPGKATTFSYDEVGRLKSATAYVLKRTADGTWHEVSSTVHWEEYAAYKKDGNLTGMWEKLGHTMLSKVAESHALRRAFPTDLSGLYTKDEMEQAEVQTIESEPVNPTIGELEGEELSSLVGSCGDEYKNRVESALSKHYGVSKYADLTPDIADRIKKSALQKKSEA